MVDFTIILLSDDGITTTFPASVLIFKIGLEFASILATIIISPKTYLLSCSNSFISVQFCSLLINYFFQFIKSLLFIKSNPIFELQYQLPKLAFVNITCFIVSLIMVFLCSGYFLKYIRCINLCDSPTSELYTNGIIQIYFYHKYSFLISVTLILNGIQCLHTLKGER